MALLRDAVQQRDLLLNLVRAQLSSRYRTTALGLMWFLLTPMLWALVLTVVFDRLIRLNIPDYPVFVLAALLPWTYFQSGVAGATTSVSRASNLVKRVRMPRIFLPLSEIATTLVHYVASLVVLFGLMLAMGAPIHPTVVLLPAVILIETMCITGLGLIGASLNVSYRDVELLLVAAMRAVFYLTPIFYPLSFVPPEWRALYLANPMAGVIQAHREIVVNGTIPAWDVWGSAIVMSALLLVSGGIMFSRREPAFEDHL